MGPLIGPAPPMRRAGMSTMTIVLMVVARARAPRLARPAAGPLQAAGTQLHDQIIDVSTGQVLGGELPKLARHIANQRNSPEVRLIIKQAGTVVDVFFDNVTRPLMCARQRQTPNPAHSPCLATSELDGEM